MEQILTQKDIQELIDMISSSWLILPGVVSERRRDRLRSKLQLMLNKKI